MKLEGSTQSQTKPPSMDPAASRGGEEPCDGDFPVEGDGGAVDSGGQAQVPPPRPPVC